MKDFSYEELEEATENFSDSRIIGKGSHGKVYKGILKDGKMVAIKKQSLGLEKLQDNSKLQNEAHILSSLSNYTNPFIINLFGTTSFINLDKSPLIIVIEYMQNGTLHELLHGKEETPSSPPPPPWPHRAQMIIQTGKAIQSLHEETEHAIIHRDIKSSNILFDENWNAKLADFGLAVALNKTNEDNHHMPAGTMGYLDPCYTKPRKLGKKTDVFSFGVLILEIISGRKVIDVSKTPSWIVDWALNLIQQGRENEVIDTRIISDKKYSNMVGTIKHFLNIAARCCVCSKIEVRPSIEEVVMEMEMMTINNSLDYVKSSSIRFGNNVLVNLLRSFVVLRNRKKKNICTSSAIFDASINHVDKSSGEKLLVREVLADITLK
ncbi:hypothetical protein LIER_24167 [Lithospermum erythrorhizon]|uniref:Protein kinase domain-containing protein n=1 Tax=Lithospermum erythrorhizon TaxID=34254 RepID=A0AAV3R081_LITER